jgi:protein associated with RNAse G/E
VPGNLDNLSRFIIKSFKHDGHLHRMWLENWRIPQEKLHPDHQNESMIVLINSQTKIREADGKEWMSRIPGVSFFIPNQWFNIVALLEDTGIRYYCNIASPPYLAKDVITYIDYDLDVIRYPDGSTHVVDQEEYERHKTSYRYSPLVEKKVKRGMDLLLERVNKGQSPFQDEQVLRYYELWEKLRDDSIS